MSLDIQPPCWAAFFESAEGAGPYSEMAVIADSTAENFEVCEQTTTTGGRVAPTEVGDYCTT